MLGTSNEGFSSGVGSSAMNALCPPPIQRRAQIGKNSSKPPVSGFSSPAKSRLHALFRRLDVIGHGVQIFDKLAAVNLVVLEPAPFAALCAQGVVTQQQRIKNRRAGLIAVEAGTSESLGEYTQRQIAFPSTRSASSRRRAGMSIFSCSTLMTPSRFLESSRKNT